MVNFSEKSPTGKTVASPEVGAGPNFLAGQRQTVEKQSATKMIQFFRRGLAQDMSQPRSWAWAISLVFHAVIFTVLVVCLRARAPYGLSDEQGREVGIALKFQDGPKQYFVDEMRAATTESGGSQSSASDASRSGERGETSLDKVVPQSAPDVSDGLPKAIPHGLGVVSNATDAGNPGGGGLAGIGEGGFGKGTGGGGGSASLFGIQTPANKVVYVFDRSASMGGIGRSPLAYAKRELIASIQSLEKTQQFQIIFYNERPYVFSPAARPGRLPFATDDNKRRALQFIHSVMADGGTQHDTALQLAIRLQPDVIFFLTDADEPRLSDAKLEQIHRWANGMVIHAIEFGLGPRAGGDNFLSRIARQNGGQYRFIDTTAIPK